MHKKLRSIDPLIFFLLFFFLAVGIKLSSWAYDWERVVFSEGYSSCSYSYFFGTNSIGQDIFARGLCALAESFESGLVIASGSLLLAFFLGVLAGFSARGFLAKKIFWLASCLEMIPFYIIILPLAKNYQDEKWPLYLLLIFILWTGPQRAFSLQVRKLLQSEFVRATLSLGASKTYLTRVHLLSSLLPLLKVEALSLFATVIKMEAFLSFLGFSLSSKIGLGQMLAEGMIDLLQGYYGNLIFSSGSLFLILFSLNSILVYTQKEYKNNLGTL